MSNYKKAIKRAMICSEIDSLDHMIGKNCPNPIQEKDNDMYYNNATAGLTVEVAPAQKTDAAKDHLLYRVSDIFEKKHEDVGDAFENPLPKTVKESKEWLASGNYRFVIPQGYTEDLEGYPFQYFCWGKTGPDEAARNAAYVALRKAKLDAIDLINVITDEEKRLQALKDFEAWTFKN